MISRTLSAYRAIPYSPFSTHISSAISSSSSSVSHHDSALLTRLSHKDWLTPNEVLNIINSLRDPSSISTFLDLYSKRKDYKPNEPFYTSVINKLAQAKMFDSVEDLMKRVKLERKNCPLSDHFFYNLIKVYGNMAGRINRAMETLYDMPTYNCWPSVKTFNFVLNLLVSAKLFDVVHEVYIRAPKLGVEIDACCLNILIKGLCSSGNLEAALHVFDEFPELRCEPTVRTYSTLMHGLCERGELKRAFGLFERMEKGGVCPDTITFNILISGLRKQGRVEEAKEVLERMKLKGCEPNASSYQEVLYGLLDAEELTEAKHVMKKMMLRGIGPSFVSYKLIINGLCKRELLDDLDWVLNQMVQQGFVPKMGMWKLILQSLFSGHPKSRDFCFENLLEG